MRENGSGGSGRSRGALDEGRRGEVQRHIKSFEKEYSGGGANMGRRRPKPGSVVVASIPARGSLDDEGNAFDGLPANRIKAQTLTQEEQATNSTDSRVLASGATNADKAVGTEHVQIGAAHKKWFGAGDTPDLPDGMRVSSGKINVAGLDPNPNTDAGKAVDLATYKGKMDDLGKVIASRATKKELGDLGKKVNVKTGPADVNRILKKRLKPSAFK